LGEKRVLFELFADTGAKERGPDLEGSLINLDCPLGPLGYE
jgi:hypothetical protein